MFMIKRFCLGLSSFRGYLAREKNHRTPLIFVNLLFNKYINRIFFSRCSYDFYSRWGYSWYQFKIIPDHDDSRGIQGDLLNMAMFIWSPCTSRLSIKGAQQNFAPEIILITKFAVLLNIFIFYFNNRLASHFDNKGGTIKK